MPQKVTAFLLTNGSLVINFTMKTLNFVNHKKMDYDADVQTSDLSSSNSFDNASTSSSWLLPDCCSVGSFGDAPMLSCD